jgi:hypothetical protein
VLLLLVLVLVLVAAQSDGTLGTHKSNNSRDPSNQLNQITPRTRILGRLQASFYPSDFTVVLGINYAAWLRTSRHSHQPIIRRYWNNISNVLGCHPRYKAADITIFSFPFSINSPRLNHNIVRYMQWKFELFIEDYRADTLTARK